MYYQLNLYLLYEFHSKKSITDLLRAGHIQYDNKNINIDNLPTFNSIAKSTDQKTINNFKSKLQGIQGVQNISSSNSYWGFSYWGNSYWGL